jgi:catecholate siderophore receptor
MSPVQGQDSSVVDTAVNATIIDVMGNPNRQRPASAKFSRELVDTAQTLSIIPESLIEQRAATTLRDVLRNVSGISMQAGEGGTPAGDQLSIRGFSARTDIFVDNVRDFGGYTRDPFNLEQVEVVKGPSSDYSGRGSTGGSINLVSKSPRMEDTTSSSLSLGSDSYSRLSLDTNRVLEQLPDTAARLNLFYHKQDTAGRDVVNNERFGIAPSLRLGVDTATETTFSLFHMQQNNIPDYGIPWVPSTNIPLGDYANGAPPVDFANWYGLKQRDFEDIATSLATVSIDRRLTATAVLQNVTRWGRTSRDSMITAPRFVSNTSTDIRRNDEKYRDQEDDILSNQTNLSWTLNQGAEVEHRILLGVEVSKEDETRYTQVVMGSDSDPTDLYNPDPSAVYLENYQRTGTASKADSTSLAIYASDSLQLSERWQVNAGLRWDRFALEYTPDGSPLLDRADRMLSYRAGVVYKPISNGSIYLGYGTSFNPTAEALSISTSSRQPGIADLDPEENRTLELGTKWELFGRRALLTAAIFNTEKTNARTQDPEDPNDLLILNGEQRVRGFEAGFAGKPSDQLSLYLGYTLLDTEITHSLDLGEIGNELSNSPRHSFNLWGTYDLTGRLQLGFGAQYTDSRWSNTDNERQAPDYTVYEASLTYMASEQLNIRLNVQNLTDERYIDYVGGGHFIPGNGRLAMLTTSFAF